MYFKLYFENEGCRSYKNFKLTDLDILYKKCKNVEKYLPFKHVEQFKGREVSRGESPRNAINVYQNKQM